MSPMSTYLADLVRDHMFRTTTTWSKPTTHYVSLHTASPAGTGANELSGNAYARVSVAVGNATWTDETESGNTTNAASVTFPQATADWGTVTHVGLWDALTGGNFLGYGTITPNRTISSGATASFATGALTWDWD